MTDKRLPDNPKEALAAYIAKLEKDYESWYEKASRRNKYFWIIAQVTMVVAGFATAIVAALIDHLASVGLTFLRILLITLPIIGSLAATLLVQTRALERKALRERGRQGIQGLIEKAKADYAAANSNEEWSVVHQQLIEDVQGVEAEQAMEFVRIARGQSNSICRFEMLTPNRLRRARRLTPDVRAAVNTSLTIEYISKRRRDDDIQTSRRLEVEEWTYSRVAA